MPSAVQLRAVWFTMRLTTLRGVKRGDEGSDCHRIQGGNSHSRNSGIEKRLR
jgi:hypothetical protein